MSHDPVNSANAAARPGGRVLLVGLVVALVLGLAAGVGVTVASGEPAVGLATAVLIVVPVLDAAAWDRSDRRKQQEAFVRDFGGSLDRVRDVLDLDHLRRMRAEQGELHAVREVRRTVPQLSLGNALEIVRTL